MKLLYLILLCFLTSCQQYEKGRDAGSAQIIFSTSWDEGVDPRIEREAIDAHAAKIVSLSDDVMHRAVEVTIRRGDSYTNVDSGTPRAELSFAKVVRFVRGGHYVIDWQTYIPKDYTVDGKQPEVISQIHQGVASGYPTFALFISESGQYGVRLRAGDGRATEGVQFGDIERDRGRAVSWRMHYIPDDTGKNSLLELQKDGNVVFRVAGVPNAYPSDDAAYFKIGLYKSAWQKKPTDVESRTMYYGRVSIVRLSSVSAR